MDIEIEYNKSLDYIYSFVDYSLTRNFKFSPEKFDLTRMENLLERMGNPHRAYPVIHVAGTKGKGSIAALTASALQSAGYRVGFYISPHLQDFTERIQVDGIPISHRELVAFVEKIKPDVASVEHLTTFEITTALSFLYFSQKKIDIAVIEVGLGGRLDATNVVSPLVSIISSISYDHVNILGDTLSQIAYEKAGIIKPGKPVVISPQKEEVRGVLERIAQERSSDLIQTGKDYLYAPIVHSLDGQSLHIWEEKEQDKANEFIESGGRVAWEPMRLFIPLLGYHQVENAATAYAGLQVARREGINITDLDIQKGFARVVWPGRFEVLRRNPPLIVDSAHNRDSALKLRLTIDDYLQGWPVILIFGASEDKDVSGMFAELIPRIKGVIATQSNHPRAMEADKLVELAHRFGCPAQSVLPIEAALAKAVQLAESETAIIAAGSLFIAAAVREVWFKSINK